VNVKYARIHVERNIRIMSWPKTASIDQSS
jgi:hypothetical protein